MGRVKTMPREARTTLGLKILTRGSQMMRASTPAASAERIMLPRLPGFSTVSTMKRRGLLESLRSSRLRDQVSPMPRRPSGFSR